MFVAGTNQLLPRLLGCGLLLLMLAGCGTSTIVIKGTYPTPLTQKLPLTIGVYYSPELRAHTHKEIDDDSGEIEYVVENGASQLQLFNTVLPALFDKVVVLDSPAQAVGNAAIDAVFIPTLSEFQLGLPQKTRLNAYEIWAKYQMKLTRANGDPLADWMMTAYGKAPQQDMLSVEAGVQSASMVAMRDLAASFTLGFAEVPAVNIWLQAHKRNKQ